MKHIIMYCFVQKIECTIGTNKYIHLFLSIDTNRLFEVRCDPCNSVNLALHVQKLIFQQIVVTLRKYKFILETKLNYVCTRVSKTKYSNKM